RIQVSTWERAMSVARTADNPLVGRGAELAALAAQLDEAAQGRGGVSLISGEPGIGKTRLARAFAEEARGRGATGLWGGCFEGDWSAPFGPWIEAIGSFFRDASPEQRRALTRGEQRVTLQPLSLLVPELAPGTGELTTPSSFGADEDRLRLHDAAVRFFLAIS